MPRTCCVDGCKSNQKTSIREEGLVTVFRFPNKREKHEKWLRAIPGKIKNIKKCKNLSICMKHFKKSNIRTKNDTQKDKRERITLTKGAIPTIFDLIPKDIEETIPHLLIDEMKQKSRSKYEMFGQKPQPRSKNQMFGQKILNDQKPLPLTKNEMFLQEILKDQIKTFANLKANIKTKVQSPEFSTLITEKNVFLYKLCYDPNKGLFVALAFSIDEHLIISIYEKNYQHQPGDFKGIMGKDGKLYFYSQIQKLMDRCPKIKCLQNEETIKRPTIEKIFIEEDNILKETFVNDERTEKIIFTI